MGGGEIRGGGREYRKKGRDREIKEERETVRQTIEREGGERENERV